MQILITSKRYHRHLSSVLKCLIEFVSSKMVFPSITSTIKLILQRETIFKRIFNCVRLRLFNIQQIRFSNLWKKKKKSFSFIMSEQQVLYKNVFFGSISARLTTIWYSINFRYFIALVQFDHGLLYFGSAYVTSTLVKFGILRLQLCTGLLAVKGLWYITRDFQTNLKICYLKFKLRFRIFQYF